MKEYKLNKEHHVLRVCSATDCESPDAWGNEDMFLVYDHRQFTVEREGFKPSSIYNYLQLSSKDDTIDLRDTDFDKYWIFPVYAYIHSGISLSLGNEGYPFNSKFDTSMTGFILVERERYVEGKFPIVNTALEAKNYAEGLLISWNHYLSGEVQEFVVVEKVMCTHCGHIEEETKDSMTGFYGEVNDELIADMLGYTEYELAKIPATDEQS